MKMRSKKMKKPQWGKMFGGDEIESLKAYKAFFEDCLNDPNIGEEGKKVTRIKLVEVIEELEELEKKQKDVK
jgi:hypothetical protein